MDIVNFGGIKFKTREEGSEAINKMITKAEEYGYASINDFYETFLGGALNHVTMFNEYGWTVEMLKEFYLDYDLKNDEYTLVYGSAKPFVKKTPDPSDMVNHPNHYKSETGIECIDAIEAATFDLKGIEAVDTANVLKYIWRWKRKNGLEDLKKARWYLDNLIAHVEKMIKESK